MTSKSLLLFDLDGTIINSEEGITKTAQYTLKEFGITVEDPVSLKHFIGPPLLDTFIDDYGFDKEKAEKAVSEYRRFFAIDGIHQYELYAGMPELIKDLHSAGRNLLIATTKLQNVAMQTLEECGLAKYFAYIAGSNIEGTRSQKVDVIRHALVNFDPTPKNKILMIGDKKHDVLGAKEAGIPCIGVTYGFGGLEELTAAGADYLVDTVEDLRTLILG